MRGAWLLLLTLIGGQPPKLVRTPKRPAPRVVDATTHDTVSRNDEQKREEAEHDGDTNALGEVDSQENPTRDPHSDNSYKSTRRSSTPRRRAVSNTL